MPVIVTMLPIMASSFFSHEMFHTLSLFLILPTSVIALFLGCRKHRHFHIVVTGVLGMAIITFTIIWGHDFLGETNEKIGISIGGIILAISHVFNFRACKAITCADKNCRDQHHH